MSAARRLAPDGRRAPAVVVVGALLACSPACAGNDADHDRDADAIVDADTVPSDAHDDTETADANDALDHGDPTDSAQDADGDAADGGDSGTGPDHAGDLPDRDGPGDADPDGPLDVAEDPGPTPCTDPSCEPSGMRGTPCLIDTDCAPPLTCGARGYCAGEPLPVAFVHDAVPGFGIEWLDDWTLAVAADELAYSPSFAFLTEPEGTSLLFTARSPLPGAACLLRAGASGWTRVPALCDRPLVNTTAVAVVPAAGGLPARLIVGGIGQLLLLDRDATSSVNLLDRLAPDDRRRACRPLHIAVDDLDLDGLLDLTVECTSPAETGGRDAANTLWLGLPDGGFEPVDDPTPWDAIGRWGRRLATGVADFDGDGLLDRFLVQDSFSLPGAWNTTAEPGYWVRTCAPTEDCVVEARPIVDGPTAWGSFMGVSPLHVEGLGNRFLVADAGPNRLLDASSPGASDDAERVGLAEGEFEGDDFRAFLFAWSSVVEDLDRDGREDLVLTQGVFEATRAIDGTAAPHPDLLFVQREPGTFSRIEEPTLVAADGAQLSRGAVSLDLDQDGLLEVFTARWQRTPLLLEEQPTDEPPRCSVRMLPRIVPAAGYGLASGRYRRAPWTVERMAGQTALQPPNEFVTTLRAGWARFPSGAVMPFDCGDGAGPVVLEEPAWLEASWAAGELRVTVESDYWPYSIRAIAAAIDGPRPATLVTLTTEDEAAAIWTAAVPVDPGRVMLRLNERWVGVWLPTQP